MDNFERAVRAQRAILAHNDNQREAEDEKLIDLLTNLMHWSRQRDLAFDKCLSMAAGHYNAERD